MIRTRTIDALAQVNTVPTIRHILFPYDGSERGREIVANVRSLAARFGAHVTIIAVAPPTFTSAPEHAGLHLRVGVDVDEWKRHLQSELDQVFVREFGDVTVERHADAGDPALRIVDFAHHHDVDLIAMPTRGAGPFRSMLVGSVAAKVLHDARCAVWTSAHADGRPTAGLPRHILCAVDGSTNTPPLVNWAKGFAEAVGATISLLHVVGTVSDFLALESERRLQDEVREIARVKIEKMLATYDLQTPLRMAVGHVARTVAEEARQMDADLVIIDRGHASQPFGRLRTNALGIIQQSPCPVLSV
jgi:nucleotide-binding universal stress UspA family protein